MLKPVFTNNLFRPLAVELIDFARELPQEAWSIPTCYPNWKVHDIFVHLFQTGAGRLSAHRDGYQKDTGLRKVQDYEALSERIDSRNSEWTQMMANLSPKLLVRLLEVTELELADFFESLGHDGVAPIGVSWAGQMESPLWFDTAREFTERWHHQQQIREAVGAESVSAPRYLKAVISTLIRAAPYWYRVKQSPEGTTVLIQIEGNSGGEWTLSFHGGEWHMGNGPVSSPTAVVYMSEDTAWRFLTRSINPTQAESRMKFSGDENLARHFLTVVAIMMPKNLR